VRCADYTVAGGRKIGGNAQAITGKRWLHHTSFLWDYDAQRMGLLRPPPKAPAYRQARPDHSGLQGCRPSRL
jgi:lipoate-protein ligase A